MKGKSKNKKYFGEVEEKALVDYIITTSTDEKHRIYNEILKVPFDKMVSSILRTYPNFIGNYDILDVEADGLSHLVENMVKFRPYIVEYRLKDMEDEKWTKHRKFRYIYEEELEEKLNELSSNEASLFEYRGFLAKAYSYCGAIVRNRFRDHSKDSRFETLTNIPLDGAGINFDEDEYFGYSENYFDDEDPVLLVFDNIIAEIDDIIENNENVTNNEKVVGFAIKELISNWEKLFLEFTNEGEYDKKISNSFNKNKILFLMKELTRMDIKDIRLNIKPYKNVYLKLKKLHNLE